MNTETIAAIATPPGKGGIGIVRVSGPLAPQICFTITKNLPEPRLAKVTSFLDAEDQAIDSGIVLYFPSPNSFTGEDVVELQGHGGPVVLDMLLKRVVQLGARLARPGEFSERAFLNNKIDLAEAEAIADLIDSSSAQAARLAIRSLQGEFSRRVRKLTDRIIEVRVYVEAAIDFPEEEVDFLSDANLKFDLQNLLKDLNVILASARQGNLIREGVTVVICGLPNVGKSTLLNCLTENDTAIVTDVAGTTRDVLRAEINIDGFPVHLIDTAGIRQSNDKIEIEGMKRTWIELEICDQVILVVDHKQGLNQQELELIQCLPDGTAITTVYNKIDLTQRSPQISADSNGVAIYLSAKQGTGVDLLRQHLKKGSTSEVAGDGNFMARLRHINALEQAEAAISTGLQQLIENGAGELLAADLMQAQQQLAAITGEFSSDDLLGQIFSSFCIGK